jgi:hypothetical protein
VVLDHGLQPLHHPAGEVIAHLRRQRLEIRTRDLQIVMRRIGRIGASTPTTSTGRASFERFAVPRCTSAPSGAHVPALRHFCTARST